jgi:hypothetical protein
VLSCCCAAFYLGESHLHFDPFGSSPTAVRRRRHLTLSRVSISCQDPGVSGFWNRLVTALPWLPIQVQNRPGHGISICLGESAWWSRCAKAVSSLRLTWPCGRITVGCRGPWTGAPTRIVRVPSSALLIPPCQANFKVLEQV